MNNNSYYVIEEKNNETDAYISHAEKVANCNNLIGYFKPFKDFTIITINACDTWKQAQEIANFWNEGAKNNGKYALA